jgi:hypothetical protein
VLHSMRVISIIVFVIVVTSSCSRRVCINRVDPWEVESKTPLVNMETKTYEGKIISDAFVNKVGEKSEDWSDLYFEIEDKGRHFIKFTDSTFTRKEAVELMDKSIKIEGSIREGYLDCEENLEYEVQSRMGKYLIITKVISE